MKRYLMSSNSIMNLNDKKSLDFQSISIDQNNNFGISSVLRLFKIFAILYHLNKIFILYNSNFIRVANMVQCASQCSGVRRGQAR